MVQVSYARVPILFGATLRAAREEIGISQEELANRAGLDRTYVSSTERGKRNPTLVTVAKLCDGLGMPMPALIAKMEETER